MSEKVEQPMAWLTRDNSNAGTYSLYLRKKPLREEDMNSHGLWQGSYDKTFTPEEVTFFCPDCRLPRGDGPIPVTLVRDYRFVKRAETVATAVQDGIVVDTGLGQELGGGA